MWRIAGGRAGWRFGITVVFLALALVMGGGGTPSPLPEMWLEVIAAIAFAGWLWAGPQNAHEHAHAHAHGLAPEPGGPQIAPAVLAIAALLIALPVLQLVPLPPSIWTSLPGRQAEVAALDLVAAADSWRPLSISPPRTLASLLSLGPPLVMMVMVSTLGPAQRRILLMALAIFGFLTVLIGATQLVGGPQAFRLYAQSHNVGITGLQANRNAAADIVLIAMLALAVLTARSSGRHHGRHHGRHREGRLPLAAFAALNVVFALTVVLTRSRMGIALLAFILIAQWGILRPQLRGWAARALPMAGGVLAVCLALLPLMRGNVALESVARRFVLTRDARFDIWSDSWYVIGQYWPFGSGMGTFVPAFIAAEPLEAVDISRPNRAHNEFLELALEGGALGLLLFALIAFILIRCAYRVLRPASDGRSADSPSPESRQYNEVHVQAICATAILLLVTMHSVVDYPLRSMSLACLAAMAAGMLARAPIGNGWDGHLPPAPS